MKRKNGITLIALVITIIVLLILAGVSISMISGNDGVATKASNASEKTRASDMQDQIDLAVSENQLAKYDDGEKNTKAELIERFVSEGKLSEEEAELLESQDSIEIGGVVVDFSKLNEKASLASQITSANYGDYVNYSKDLGLTLNLEGETTAPTTDWRIFYKDGERIYLIAADYVPNTSSLLKLSNAGMSVNGDYSVLWEEAPTTLSKVARKDSLFGITSNSYVLDESKGNSRCVSALLDTANWSNFVDSSVADYAIGGPTIEMYLNSWNAKGYMDITETSSSSDTGYKVNGSTLVKPETDPGYSDNLYYPHKNTTTVGSEGCIGYWLASPSAEGEEFVMFIRNNSSIYNDYYNYNYYTGIRPIVALNAGVTAEQDANGVWQLK